uniref:glycoside hydrolase family 15 protein n=1 Tax=Pollutimonas thiosulfatoxidans TaxID=2028345 RepID=UPI001D18EFE5|nr:trehalase-like domain-containing protein [Pollutimonas thiosulfatoxidans]
MAPRIEDYALLGNCRTAALVSKLGSIDWLCFPRFDAAACFAAMLGTPENGRWQISPTSPIRNIKRHYHDGTMILETTFVTDEGVATLIDFMPSTFTHSSVARIVVGVQGRVTFDMDLVIRFDYGRTVPWVEKHDPRTLTAVAGPDMLVLRTDVPLKARAKHTNARFTVAQGERKVFTLSHQPSHEPVADAFDAEAALAKTEYFWHEFSSRCPDVGPWSALVKRSLITLKALTYLPTGASWPRPPRPCPSSSAASATGTTAIAGCAMPP